MASLSGTILVTGGMGFIGSNFVRYLLREHPAARVVNLDKVTYAGNPRNMANVAEDARYTVVRADVCDANAVAEALTAHEVDQIVHFAAETHVDRSILEAGDFIRTNVEGPAWSWTRRGRRWCGGSCTSRPTKSNGHDRRGTGARAEPRPRNFIDSRP